MFCVVVIKFIHQSCLSQVLSTALHHVTPFLTFSRRLLHFGRHFYCSCCGRRASAFSQRDDLLCVCATTSKLVSRPPARERRWLFRQSFSELRVLSSFLTKLLGRRFVFPKILVFAESSSRTTSSSFLIFIFFAVDLDSLFERLLT